MIFMCFCCFTGDNMPSDGPSGNTGAIVGGVVGALAVIAAVVAVVLIKKRKDKGKHSNLANIILPASSAATCRQHTLYRESENIERY